MKDRDMREIAQAVHRWLEYQVLCGRGELLSEGHLGQPIAEMIIAKGTGIAESEHPHPNLQTAKKGRPRQIDYVILGKQKEGVVAAIETKWAGSTRLTGQGVACDLLRLECIRNDSGQHADRFFLVAGRTTDFKHQFMNLAFNAVGKRLKLLDGFLPCHDGQTMIVKVKNCEQPWRKFFEQFRTDYKTELPINFKTRCVAWYQHGSASVAAWRVSSNQNRKTFDGYE